MPLKRFLQDKSGVTAVEYGLIVAMIAIAITLTLRSTGNSLSDHWNNNANKVVNLTKKS